MGLGLAFSAQQVVLCRARRRRGRIEVAQVESAPLPAGALAAAFGTPNLLDVDACEAALGGALVRARVGRSAVAVALPDPSVRVRLLPQAPRGGTRAETGRLVAWQLRDTLPFPPEQARVDCVPLGDGGGALCLVGAEPVVSQYEALLGRRHLLPVHVGAASLALWHLVETAAVPGPWLEEPASRCALFVEDGHATLVAAAAGAPRFWRGIAEAGPEALAREVGDSLHALAEEGTLPRAPRLLVHAPAARRDEIALALRREIDVTVEALEWPPEVPADPAVLPALAAALVA